MKNRVIFESEEECAEFLCNVYDHNKEYCLRSLVPMAKQKGYIRKSIVEEAEEIIKEFEFCKYHKEPLQRVQLLSTDCVKIYTAWQELKSELKAIKEARG